MNQLIRFAKTGGPEVLYVDHEASLPEPGKGQVLIRQTAIGVNFIDTYYRHGLYPVSLPSVLGNEAAGVVETVGEGVEGFAPGDRVAYAGGALGAYSQVRCVPATLLVKLPDGIADDVAASIMLKGMTVEYLVQRTYAVKPGQTVLWHAVAGGVGQIALQWLLAEGVNVIGTVGSAEKASLARTLGCQHVINYRTEDVVAKVKALTQDRGVPVVYDSVGKDTFSISLACLSRRGMLVSFGNASGAVPDFSLLELARHGSLYVTRPMLFDYIQSREELNASAHALFQRILDKKIQIQPSHRYPLAEVVQAHRDLESRKTTGSVILIPD